MVPDGPASPGLDVQPETCSALPRGPGTSLQLGQVVPTCRRLTRTGRQITTLHICVKVRGKCPLE